MQVEASRSYSVSSSTTILCVTDIFSISRLIIVVSLGSCAASINIIILILIVCFVVVECPTLLCPSLCGALSNPVMLMQVLCSGRSLTWVAVNAHGCSRCLCATSPTWVSIASSSDRRRTPSNLQTCIVHAVLFSWLRVITTHSSGVLRTVTCPPHAPQQVVITF